MMSILFTYSVYIYILCACVHTYTHVNLCLHVNPSFPADAAGVRWWVWRQQIAPTSAFMEPGACSCQSKTRGRICKTHSEAKYRIERHCPATTRNSVCLWAPILRALRYNNIIYIYNLSRYLTWDCVLQCYTLRGCLKMHWKLWPTVTCRSTHGHCKAHSEANGEGH